MRTDHNPAFSEPHLVIVIPAYNEQENISSLVRAIRRTLYQGFYSESTILVVDDGSTDNTWQICKAIASADDNFVAARLIKNFGKEAAIMVGLFLLESPLYVVLDADGQHDPTYLCKMLYSLEAEDLELVIGERIDYVPGNMSFFTKAYYKLLRTFAGQDYEKLCDFSAFTIALRNYILANYSSSLVFKMLIFDSTSRKKLIPLVIPRITNRTRRWSTVQLFSKGLSTIYSLSAFNLIIFLILILIAITTVATVTVGVFVNHLILNLVLPRGYLTILSLNVVLVLELTIFLLAYLLKERHRKLPKDLSSLVSDFIGKCEIHR